MKIVKLSLVISGLGILVYIVRYHAASLRYRWRPVISAFIILIFWLLYLLFIDGNEADASVPEATESERLDDSVLGTVDVTGSASTRALPKLGVVPVISQSDADTTLQLVVRGDLDRSGQFRVLSDDDVPSGIYLHDSPLDLGPWRAQGIETVVKVIAKKKEGDNFDLLASVYMSGRSEPVFEHAIETDRGELRANAHRISDALLAALTGRPGGFASRMIYTARVGRHYQVFTIDADGFDLRPRSPSGHTAIVPSYGPGEEIFYSYSHNFGPFRLARGSRAEIIPFDVEGSLMGLAFSADRKKLAASLAFAGESQIFVGDVDGKNLKPVSKETLANHPAFGPQGQVAYVAGGTAGQRVYVDGKAISPAGFNASAPAFCDTPNGLMVVFSVNIGGGMMDIVATNARGGNLTRITQNRGSNSYPACSPDGRLIAFFSTRKSDQGPGLYVVPLAAPWHARRISSELGKSLRWDPLPSN